MEGSDADQILDVRKYPNRRYYDVTRSKHVTLTDLLELTLTGHAIRVTDSRTAVDITNRVLAQILLERGQPKLDLLPTWILRQVIRTPAEDLKGMVARLPTSIASRLGEPESAASEAPQDDLPTQEGHESQKASDIEGQAEPHHVDQPSEHLAELRVQLRVLTQRIETLTGRSEPLH